jgi:hypothetical protein
LERSRRRKGCATGAPFRISLGFKQLARSLHEFAVHGLTSRNHACGNGHHQNRLGSGKPGPRLASILAAREPPIKEH